MAWTILAPLGRARVGAGTFRTHFNDPGGIDSGNAAATGTDGIDVEHRQAEYDTKIEILLIGGHRLAAADDAGGECRRECDGRFNIR